MKYVYCIQDSQGRTIGVFEAALTACNELLEHSYSIVDNPYIQAINCPNDNVTIAAIYENGKRVFSVESDGFTVQKMEVKKHD